MPSDDRERPGRAWRTRSRSSGGGHTSCPAAAVRAPTPFAHPSLGRDSPLEHAGMKRFAVPARRNSADAADTLRPGRAYACGRAWKSVLDQGGTMSLGWDAHRARRRVPCRSGQWQIPWPGTRCRRPRGSCHESCMGERRWPGHRNRSQRPRLGHKPWAIDYLTQTRARAACPPPVTSSRTAGGGSARAAVACAWRPEHPRPAGPCPRPDRTARRAGDRPYPSA